MLGVPRNRSLLSDLGVRGAGEQDLPRLRVHALQVPPARRRGAHPCVGHSRPRTAGASAGGCREGGCDVRTFLVEGGRRTPSRSLLFGVPPHRGSSRTLQGRRGREDLPGRRRALSRHDLVPHGRRGPEALAQPVV